MKQCYHAKKSIVAKFAIVVLFIFVDNLTACSPIREKVFIKVENEAEQYKKMEQELKDLKIIKVKCLAPEWYTEKQKKIYESYFRYKNDMECQQQENYGSKQVIVYETKDMYQRMEWGEHYIDYSGTLFGREYVYETTEENIIQEETEKLFALLGLEYNNMKDGYAIHRIAVKEDNSIVVYVRRYIGGKKLSLSGATSPELPDVDDIQITFGNNQVIGIRLVRLSETVEIKEYEEAALVNTPQKAYKLLANFFRTALGTEEWTADTAQIAYVTGGAEDDMYVLRPVAEFYRVGTEKVYQVDLTTKEVVDTVY